MIVYNKILTINLIYDIQLSNKVSLLLNFKCDLDYAKIILNQLEVKFYWIIIKLKIFKI